MVLDTRASVLAMAGTAMVVVCTAGARADFMVPPDAPILPGTGATVEEILDPDGPFKGSFTVFDKRFDFTSFVPVGASTQPDLVTVVPWVAPNPLDAVGFDLIGQWVDPAGDALATGFTIVFDVTVLDPDLLINDARLTFNGSASGPGSFAKVSETITDPEGGGGLIDNLEVTADISEDFWQGAPDEGYPHHQRREGLHALRTARWRLRRRVLHQADLQPDSQPRKRLLWPAWPSRRASLVVAAARTDGSVQPSDSSPRAVRCSRGVFVRTTRAESVSSTIRDGFFTT
jgi:hypothetical protein